MAQTAQQLVDVIASSVKKYYAKTTFLGTRSQLDAAASKPELGMTGFLTDAGQFLIGLGASKAPLEFAPVAPVLINVPEDYPTVEAALNSLAGKQQNSTATEIKVNANYLIPAQEAWRGYGLTNIVVTTDSAAPKTITVNTATGINFKDGGIILENLHITSSSASNLLYFARIGNKVILSNLTLTCTSGRVFTADISKVEVNDCDIASSGMLLQDSDCVVRRCDMTGNNAAADIGVWADGNTYARVENTTFTDFNIGEQVTNNSTLRRSAPSYTNVSTNVSTDSTSSVY